MTTWLPSGKAHTGSALFLSCFCVFKVPIGSLAVTSPSVTCVAFHVVRSDTQQSRFLLGWHGLLVGQWEPFGLASEPLEDTVIAGGLLAVGCHVVPQLVWCASCPSPSARRFSQEPWLLLLGNGTGAAVAFLTFPDSTACPGLGSMDTQVTV